MDSFSRSSKLEIINQNIDAEKSGIPFLFGLFASTGEIDVDGNLALITDIPELYPYVFKLIKNILKINNKLFNFDLNNLENYIIENNEFKINKKIFFRIIFKNNILNNLFNYFGITENNSIKENIECVTKNIDAIKGLCKGLYIGLATSSIKISEKANEKTSSGYHLEFASKSHDLLFELSHILADFEICAKLIKRKTNYVLYIKYAEHVSDTLALVGANNAVLTLKSEMTKREFRNKINRQTNCLSGNISKTVDASLKQIQAIEKIENTIGLNSLSPDLEEVALMRLANPEEPLNMLLKLSNLNITKSGLNHRLRKIVSIADKL